MCTYTHIHFQIYDILFQVPSWVQDSSTSNSQQSKNYLFMHHLRCNNIVSILVNVSSQPSDEEGDIPVDVSCKFLYPNNDEDFTMRG